VDKVDKVDKKDNVAKCMRRRVEEWRWDEVR
jgi:hypothetical protein